MSSHGRNTIWSNPRVFRPVLWALVVVVLIFIAYEVVERLWLQDLDSQTLHVLHLWRGLLSSIIAALLVGWFLVKTSPSLFSPSVSSKPLVQIERPTGKQRLDNFTHWFILMRWIAVLVAWLLTFLIVQVAEWLPREVWWPLVFTIGGLATLNLIYEYIFRKGMFKRILLPFQTYTDLIILVILMHFSGGIENPLSLLMLFHVIIAGIVLNREHCYAVAVSASVLLAMLAVGEAAGILDHYTLTIFPHAVHEAELAHASHQPFYVASYVGLLTAIYFLTAYFVTTMTDRIRFGERQLEKFAGHALEQRQLIEKALETTETGLCVCNNEGEPYWTNQSWEAWFGKKTFDLFIEQNQLEESLPICKAFKDGRTRVNEITLSHHAPKKHDGTILRVTSAPLYDKDGRIDQVVSLVQDITEQKKVQKQLIRAGRLAAVGELAGHVAHEVNNPIGIISAKCRILLDEYHDELTPKVSQELEKITAAADRVAHIAKGLLSYCRPSTARRTVIDIGAPIREAMSMISRHAEELNVEIDDRVSDNLPSTKANTNEIQQVFLNLFLNALDAMPNGGVLQITTSGIEETGRDTDHELIITVQDTGTGIPDDIKDQIFEPFFTTKEQGKGTGLGLSVCSGLIRSHGGTIDIESEMGQGTSVTIRLPVTVQSKEEYAGKNPNSGR